MASLLARLRAWVINHLAKHHPGEVLANPALQERFLKSVYTTMQTVERPGAVVMYGNLWDLLATWQRMGFKDCIVQEFGNGIRLQISVKNLSREIQ